MPMIPIRRPLLVFLALLAAVLRTAGQPGDADSPEPVVFTAMGCGPYSPAAEKALARFIKIENNNPTSAFIIHCGDIMTGKVKDWPESQYAKVAGILSAGNRIPTFVVPGDNEWNDQVDPDRHWGYWKKHFMDFNNKWPLPDASPVARQKERPENFSFVLDGVLFIGINKVGGRVHDAKEWKQRHQDNANWVAARMTEHRDQTRAAAIFAQATAAGNTPAFVQALRKAAAAYKHPILYLHADGHKWFVRKKEWAANITHVQLDVVDARFPPVQVRVTGDKAEPFTFDRRLQDPAWQPTR